MIWQRKPKLQRPVADEVALYSTDQLRAAYHDAAGSELVRLRNCNISRTELAQEIRYRIGVDKPSKGMQWFSVLTSVTAFLISIATFASTFLEHEKVEILVSNPKLEVTETPTGIYDTVGVSLGLTGLNEGNRSAALISATVIYFLDEREDEDDNRICKEIAGYRGP